MEGMRVHLASNARTPPVSGSAQQEQEGVRVACDISKRRTKEDISWAAWHGRGGSFLLNIAVF